MCVNEKDRYFIILTTTRARANAFNVYMVLIRKQYVRTIKLANTNARVAYLSARSDKKLNEKEMRRLR